jgi:GT2 family glycosyltransferase
MPEPDSSPLVSIIIVNHNGEKLLSDCLASLRDLEYKNYEIILVDNSSSDGSINLIENHFPLIHLIRLEKNYGYAIANNIAARIAKGDLLLFLNNDTNVTNGFLSSLVSAMRLENADICQPMLLYPDGRIDSAGDYVDILGRAYNSKSHTSTIKNILSARGACMLIKRSVFSALNGFDEKFFVGFEDVDLGWRAWIIGYKTILVPNSIVYHLGGQTTNKFTDIMEFHSVKNNLMLRFTNFDTYFCVKSIFLFILINSIKKFFGISLIKEIESSQTLPSFRTIMQSVGWIVRNFSYLWKKRREIQLRKVRSTDDLIRLDLITKV